MANAKQCDRCGKFYKNNKLLSDKGLFISQIYTASNDTILEKFDLCDECILKLHNFMKGENK